VGETLESVHLYEGASVFLVAGILLDPIEFPALTDVVSVPTWDTHRGMGPNAAPPAGGVRIDRVVTLAARLVLAIDGGSAGDTVTLSASLRGEGLFAYESIVLVAANETHVRDLFWPRFSFNYLTIAGVTALSVSCRLFSFGRGV
jgi:hypothetical protein